MTNHPITDDEVLYGWCGALFYRTSTNRSKWICYDFYGDGPWVGIVDDFGRIVPIRSN